MFKETRLYEERKHIVITYGKQNVLYNVIMGGQRCHGKVGTRAKQVKAPFRRPECYSRLSYSPAKPRRKPADNGSNTCVPPSNHMVDLDAVPGSWLPPGASFPPV